VEQEVIEPAEVKENPEAFRCIGEEVTEMLDYRPAKFFRHQIIRRKFVHRQQPELAPIIAPLPESLQQRWVAHRPGEDVLFEWQTTREAKCLQKLIPIDFNGTVQCDGYSAYDHFARHRASQGKPILLAGCWAHTRRGFYEALDHAPKEAGWLLIQIGHLYDIERRLRRQRAGRALRNAYRSSQSRPICARIRRLLQRWYITRRFLPQSTMGKAIHYALDQWESLEVYLQDPLIEIDNNLVENAIRPTALGKKNWLFFGAANAGERAAVIYSIIESCRRHGVEPYSYLRDVLTRLPSMTNRQIKDIVPKAWAAAKKADATRKAA